MRIDQVEIKSLSYLADGHKLAWPGIIERRDAFIAGAYDIN